MPNPTPEAIGEADRIRKMHFLTIALAATSGNEGDLAEACRLAEDDIASAITAAIDAEAEKMRERAAKVAQQSRRAPACPFDGPNDLEPTDPCPVCGDLGTFDKENLDRAPKCGTVNKAIAAAIRALPLRGDKP